MKKKPLRENQTVIVKRGGKSVKGSVVNSPTAGKITVRLPAETPEGEAEDLIFTSDELEPMGAVGRKYHGDAMRATTPPREFAAFIRHGNYTCIRVAVGVQYTKFIPMDAVGLSIQTMENADFGRTYRELEGYGLGTAVFHYLRAAERFGCSAPALEILMSLQHFITETETEALVAKVKKDNPSMTSAEIKSMIMKGLPPEQFEKMNKVGEGAMAVIAKHEPDSASAKYLAAKKKGPAALKKHLKEDAKASKQPAAQPKEQEDMAAKKKGKKAAKPAAAKKPAAAPVTKANGKKKPPVRVSAQGEDSKITLLVKENPKREGTNGFKAFAKYKTGMTVGDFLKKGGTRADLRWDISHEYIRVK